MRDAPTHVWVNVKGKTGLISLQTLLESFEVELGEFFGFLKGRMFEKVHCSGDAAGSGKEPVFTISKMEDVTTFVEKVRAWLVEVNTPKIRTPLTVENLKKWAEEHVALNPIRKVDRWDTESKSVKTVDIANTTALVLADILHAQALNSLTDQKAYDLFEIIRDLYWEGTKGFQHYTEAEALKEIEGDLMDPVNSSHDFGDLEDLLETFGPDADQNG